MLESHLEGEIRYHLHLNSCKLNDTKDEVRNLQLEVAERAQAVQNQFEERVQALQNHFDDRLQALQNRFEESVQALENHFEERVKLLTVTSDKLRKNLSFTRIICAVAVVILAALSGMSNQESAVKDLKTKVDLSFERQSKLEMKMNEVEKGLKGELIDLLGKKVDEASKYFEAVSLNMSNHDSAISDFKTKMDRSVDRQSKLELKINEVEKGLKRELIDLRSHLGNKVDEVNKYFEAVSLNMSNHDSAISDFKTKMDRSVDRQSKLELKINEVEKGLKRELIDLRSHLGNKVDEVNKYFEAVSLNMSNHESAISDFKTKMDRSVDRQSKLELKINEVEKGLKRELIDLRSHLGNKVDEVNKYFEAVSLNMSNHESAISDFKTKMDRSVDRQSKLEMKMNEVEKGLKRELIDLRSQLGKKVDEANKYFEAVSLNMSNHESAVSDFKTKMEGRVTDVQTKVEGRLDEAHKHLKEKVS